jgi:hypothetical protein
MIEITLPMLLQVAQILVIIIGGAMVLGALRQNVQALTVRMTGVETEVRKLVDVLIAIGRQDERTTNLERRVTALEEQRR